MQNAHRDLGHEREGAARVEALPAAQVAAAAQGRRGHGLGLEHRRPQQLQDRKQSQGLVVTRVKHCKLAQSKREQNDACGAFSKRFL